MSTPPTLSCGVWPIYLYLLRRLSTRQCSHLLPSAVTAGAVAAERTCSWYAAPAIDRYLLPAGRLAAKPLAVAAVDRWDRQTGETDRHTTRQRQELFRKKSFPVFPESLFQETSMSRSQTSATVVTVASTSVSRHNFGLHLGLRHMLMTISLFRGSFSCPLYSLGWRRGVVVSGVRQ